MAEICTDRHQLDLRLDPLRAGGATVGLVPTMGALHAGHLSLVRQVREPVDHVVVSIFVNPLQFAPGEDLDRYPRTLAADTEALAAVGADTVYVPEVADLYPYGVGSGVTVDPGALGGVLEGAARPTHFRGVLTVVAKLLGIVRPGTAVFGEKDYQQLVLIQRMVHELGLPVEIAAGAIVREPDGLALSSRNRYLDEAQRCSALTLSRAIAAGVHRAERGAGAAEVEAAARTVLDQEPGVEPDYVALTDPHLGPAPPAGPARLLVAGRVGTTRLLDNTGLTLQG